MDSAISLHHACFRHLIPRYTGYEAQVEGDSFVTAFHNVRDATLFTIAIQVRGGEAGVRAGVRMGVTQEARGSVVGGASRRQNRRAAQVSATQFWARHSSGSGMGAEGAAGWASRACLHVCV